MTAPPAIHIGFGCCAGSIAFTIPCAISRTVVYQVPTDASNGSARDGGGVQSGDRVGERCERASQEARLRRVSTMNVNLEVVSIPVSDVERALEFYRDRLG